MKINSTFQNTNWRQPCNTNFNKSYNFYNKKHLALDKIKVNVGKILRGLSH